MQYSGVVLTAAPGNLPSIQEALSRLPGVEIHHIRPDRGMLVLVLEAETVPCHQELFRAIQAVPSVLETELVYHYVDTPPESAPAADPSFRPAGGSS